MKRWLVLPKKSDNILEQLLINRRIPKKDWDAFLNPDFEKALHDPFLMKGMKEAVERVLLAIKNKETIGLFGDYDADGIPGTVLLDETLKLLGLKTYIYIPSREQGYGLNKEGIDFFKTRGVKLILAIDLGVSNPQEVAYAVRLGLDLIILDHHQIKKLIPMAIVLDPKQRGDRYPFKDLAATGVVFKLIQGLGQKIAQINSAFLKWSLDLVAISTICDIVPLIGENRLFAKFGLIVLRKTRRIGLQELYRKAAILAENIDTYSVGFQIGPRLNAPGRIDHANESFHLLVSKEKKEASELADKLDRINRRRQQELERVLKEAREKVSRLRLHQKKVILVDGKNWPHGIIGLVAGKLMEEFARPVIVCERREKDLRGSARSIDAYNMVEALDEAKDYLLKYGGHKRAAGLTLELEHLSNLYDKLLEVAESKLRDEDLVPKISIDAKLEIEDINFDLLKLIQDFGPHGLGNPRPVFMLEKVNINNIRTVGKENKHLKFKAGDMGAIDAIGFDLGSWVSKINENQKVDLAFTIDEDIWDGNRKLQLKVLDIRI